MLSTSTRRGTGIIRPDQVTSRNLTGWWHWNRDIALNGPNVSAQGDQSGLGHHIIQAVANDQPLWVGSGGPNNAGYVEYDGVSEYLQGIWAQAQPTHMFAVIMPGAVYTLNETFLDGSVGNSRRVYVSAPNTLTAFSTAASIVKSGVTTTAWNRFEFLFNGASSRVRVNSIDGDLGTVGAAASNGLTIGSHVPPGFFADCRVAEIATFDGEVDLGEALGLELYFYNDYLL